MNTKKKTTAKKTAKKKTTAFDDALTPPSSKVILQVKPSTIEAIGPLANTVAVKPMEVTALEQFMDHEDFSKLSSEPEGGEPWPNYSPFPEDEDTGPGFSPTNIAPVTEKVDEVVESWDESPKEEEPALGSGSPVEVSDPISGTNMPADASKTVTDLIDGLNYLWTMCKTIRGPRGPKQHDESILKKRVAAGRQLLASLK